MIEIVPKIKDTGLTIFTKMSALAKRHEAINLGQGFPNFDCDENLRSLVSKYLNEEKNQYAPMAGVPELRQALADKYHLMYEAKLDYERNITITAGATQALFNAISALVGRGDEVIVFEPAYDSYKPVIEMCGATPVPVALKAPDFRVDWQYVQDIMNDKTRMIIINNPHNPLGTILRRNDLLQLQNMLEDSNTILLSDEVYEHLVYDGNEHESVLKYPRLFERSVICYSFGKTFHNTGWKMGYCIAPEALTKAVRQIHQWNVFSVNSFCQYALADYLKDESNYMDLAQFYQQKRDCFASLMEDSMFKPLPCSGSYFQLYDYSELSDKNDVEFAEELVTEYGVASIPISVFYSEKTNDKILRFCFAKTEDTLQQAAEILCRIKPKE